MSWITDTIAGRTIVILVLGLGSVLALAQYLHQRGIEREVTARNTAAVVERLIVLSDSIMAIDPSRRDEAAHGLSGGPIELHWGREPLATPGGNLDIVAMRLRNGLLERLPAHTRDGLVIGSSRPKSAGAAPTLANGNDHHTTLLSLPLADRTWLNVTLARVELARATSPSALISILLGSSGVILLSFLMSRWLTRPLQLLADGARHLFLAPGYSPLPERGTREVRTLANAINELQDRIRRLVNERTHMLAAVSHDLRTPLTRLRLRVAALQDDALRRKIEDDLHEMEDMIKATLAFLRDELAEEEVGHVDLMAILETIEADAVDMGEQVRIEGPRHVVVKGRHLALKRALSNLIQNALKYGGLAKIRASCDSDKIAILIEDEGPGIPDDQIAAVFEPFVRGAEHRARCSSGHGLGLTVAQSILRSHGGSVTLSNISPKGLRVRVELPMSTTV